MKLFRLPQPEKRSAVIRAVTGDYSESAAGVYVGPESSLASTAVLAATRVLSESIASLPLIVYRRVGRAKERAPEHPLYKVLHDRANPDMTAFSMRRLMVAHWCMYGNSYAEIEWDRRGQVVGLWPMHPSRVGVERAYGTGELQYTYYSSLGKGVVLPAWRVFHTKWLESDGVVGQSPIQIATGAVGLSLAMDKFAGSYFANGARPSVILKHPSVLKPEAYDRLRESFSSQWAGLNNAHRVQIIEEGMDVTTVGTPPEEAQLLEARKFQVNEIARMFRVPPHLLADLDRATFSNVEHQGIEFLQYTLTPMLVSIEQEIRRQLMTDSELESYDVEHVVDGLLRGDTATRYGVYVQAVGNAIMSVNEARSLENMPPIEGGDTYYMPLNLAPLGSQPDPKTPVSDGADAPMVDGSSDAQDTQDAEDDVAEDAPVEPKRSLAAAEWVSPLLRDVAERLVKRAVADIEKQGTAIQRKQGMEKLSEWANNDLRTSLEAYGINAMRPVLQSVRSTTARNAQVHDVLRTWSASTGQWTLTSDQDTGSIIVVDIKEELVSRLYESLMEVFDE